MTQAIDRAEKLTIQTLEDARNGTGGAFPFDGYIEARGEILPRWGSRGREHALRQWDRNPWLWLWQGAKAGLIKKIASTPWEIVAGRNAARYFQTVLREAQFGAGWTHFISLVANDYLRHDIGAFIEVIAPGDPLREPTGAIVGLAYLDAMRCFPTRDPEYPVIYWGRNSDKHLLHWSRVIRLYDVPDGDEMYPGVGLCALSRAISILTRETQMGRYIHTQLDDKPAPGMVTVSGMVKEQFNKALNDYRAGTTNDALPDFGRTMFLFGVDRDAVPQITATSFSTPPEKFSYREYTELDVKALALALGVDILDLWEITSAGLGSGAQSEIMAQKSKGRTYGAFLSSVERALNTTLPDTVEFEFKPKDAQEDAETATAASTWANTIQVLGDKLTPDEARQLLANQVPAIRDAITDEAGQIRRLNDMSDADVLSAGIETDVQTTTPVTVETTVDDAAPIAAKARMLKGYATTSAEFIDEIAANMDTAANGTLPQGNVANRVVRVLYRYGQQAYKDGLATGGVVVTALDADETARVQAWLADQTGYVDAMVARLYGTARGRDTPATTADYLSQAALWANKSLRTVFQRGVGDADKNGMYQWKLGGTERHCVTCLALNGQMHRMKEYEKRGLLPGSSTLACGGWRCDCKLVKAAGKPRGRFPSGGVKHAH